MRAGTASIGAVFLLHTVALAGMVWGAVHLFADPCILWDAEIRDIFPHLHANPRCFEAGWTSWSRPEAMVLLGLVGAVVASSPFAALADRWREWRGVSTGIGAGLVVLGLATLFFLEPDILLLIVMDEISMILSPALSPVLLVFGSGFLLLRRGARDPKRQRWEVRTVRLVGNFLATAVALVFCSASFLMWTIGGAALFGLLGWWLGAVFTGLLVAFVLWWFRRLERGPQDVEPVTGA